MYLNVHCFLFVRNLALTQKNVTPIGLNHLMYIFFRIIPQFLRVFPKVSIPEKRLSTFGPSFFFIICKQSIDFN